MSMDNFNKKYEKKNPFSVPDGYFEQLEDRLMEQVGKREKHRKEGIWLLVKPYLGLTGVFLLALFVVQIILPAVVDKHQMVIKQGGEVVQHLEINEENVFDARFNPTNEEIIEYLFSEMDSYELLYAENY